MSFRVKAKCLRCSFRKEDFTIFNWSPVMEKGTIPNQLQLSKYFTFSTKGCDGYLDEGKEYELELEEISCSPQWGSTCRIVSVPSMTEQDIASMSREEKFNILMQCTSSERIANNILDIYPDYIERVLNEGEESIDPKPVKGMGAKFHKAYCRQLLDKYKYFNIFNKFSNWGIDMIDARALSGRFGNEEEIRNAFEKDPYEVLIDVCGKKFLNVDQVILTQSPQFKETETRCAHLMLEVLAKNEEDTCSTRLYGNDLYCYIRDNLNYPELLPLIVPTAQKSELIYFDESTKDLAKMSTYSGECRIADFIKNKLGNNHTLDVDCEKYRIFDGIELSDEQFGALKMFCEKDFMLLVGAAGCVDAETEFFNGKSWKKISEYTEDDLVLQYNEDGSANLVKPYRYINEPCNMMYHFETKYGLDQTLTPDHRCVTKTANGVIKENTMQEIYDKHNDRSRQGFPNKFMTTFSYEGKGIDLTDAEIKLMCAVICDGSFYNKANRKQDSWNICRFHIKKERKKIKLREIFKECDLKWREKESSAEGYTDFYVKAPRREKEFTEYWYDCSQHQLQVICDNIMFWDGNENTTPNGVTRKRFSTTIKQTADFIQFAFSACGYRATININDRRGRIRTVNGKNYIQKTIDYNVGITERTLVGFSKPCDHGETTKIESVVPNDGRKYCFTVPSNMLVLRRNNKIFITGNCGKTQSLKAVLDLCDDNGLTYSLFSFSGAAALRMTEATGRPASTIHRPYYQEREFHDDVIIVDEFSFMDVETTNMLITMIANPDAKIIFVGDPSQIQSVGCGNVFYDIINSEKVPVTELTAVFRYNSNGMLFVATNIRRGIDFFDDPMVKRAGNEYKVSNNWTFIETDNIFDIVIGEYTKLLNKGVKPKDILCLSPQKADECGTYKLNTAIQNIVNPIKPNQLSLSRIIGSTTMNFRVGDKVVNTRNDYKVLSLEAYLEVENSGGVLTADDVDHTAIFNGQVGYIRDLNEKYCVIQFNEELVVFDKNKVAHDLLLAYAITYHKAQGAESDYVINVLSENHKRMRIRNLGYVAETRAKKMQIDVGSIEALKEAIAVDGNKLRDTFLKELLTEQQGLDN